MKRAKFLLVGLVAAAPLMVPAPAQAACFGSQQQAFVCVEVDPDGGGTYEDCLWVGSKCYRVSVPIPSVEYGCGGQAITCS